MNLTIRPVRDTDKAEWRALWTAYLSFYNTELENEVYESTFNRLLSSGDYEPSAFLAIIDNRAVGLVHYLFHRHCWSLENDCYLQDLFVANDARGLGVGAALIEAVYQQADAAAAPSVYWLTALDNTVARKLYDKVATQIPFTKYKKQLQ